jgi:hypothetical protein
MGGKGEVRILKVSLRSHSDPNDSLRTCYTIDNPSLTKGLQGNVVHNAPIKLAHLEAQPVRIGFPLNPGRPIQLRPTTNQLSVGKFFGGWHPVGLMRVAR